MNIEMPENVSRAELYRKAATGLNRAFTLALRSKARAPPNATRRARPALRRGVGARRLTNGSALNRSRSRSSRSRRV